MIDNILTLVAAVALVVMGGIGYHAIVTPPTVAVPSDVNQDGVVNLQDVSIVMANLATTTISAPK